MQQLLKNQHTLLMEAAVVERLRRQPSVKLDKQLLNAALIYSVPGQQALQTIYREYVDIALQAKQSLLLCSPTWRANQLRVEKSEFSQSINADAVHFMQTLRDSYGSQASMIKVGGLMGCKNDCYQPQQGLSSTEAEDFHRWQAQQLADAGADFLIAQTLPSVDEALGIALAMQSTGLPYIISFVINRDGRILDGITLAAAFEHIDQHTNNSALGFMVNCAYPSFLCAQQQPTQIFDRLIGFQANASSLDHCELDQAQQLHMNPVAEWAEQMLTLNQRYGVKVLGGCCGTTGEHLRQLIALLNTQQAS